MVRRNTRALGDRGEQLAYQYLCKQGLLPVARNYRCRHGEIDLVMLDRGCLVFVEVRYRSGRKITRAAVTVDVRKQRKLVKAAEMFLASRRKYAARGSRFDVVGIERDTRGKTYFEWLRDAFWP